MQTANTILDTTGNELTNASTPSGVKVRLARVFKRSGQTMVDFNNEVKELTDKDLSDFSEWFTAAGYPTVVKA